jgi:AcrR family transcriptional regulator
MHSDSVRLLSIGRDGVARCVLVATISSSRRIGAEDSKTRTQLLDAAERLLLEEGYAAVTSRRVAAKAGLKPQLVHYYFRTMDDLFLDVFRRRAERDLAGFERAIAEDGSLRNLWRLNADPRGVAFTMEFVALGNHRKAIRAEIARYAERFRATQVEAVTAALADHHIPEDRLPPIVALLTMTGLSQVLALEDALGVTTGHDSTREFIERFIDQLERPPARRRAPRAPQRQPGTRPRGLGKGRSV